MESYHNSIGLSCLKPRRLPQTGKRASFLSLWYRYVSISYFCGFSRPLFEETVNLSRKKRLTAFYSPLHIFVLSSPVKVPGHLPVQDLLSFLLHSAVRFPLHPLLYECFRPLLPEFHCTRPQGQRFPDCLLL